jgi:competence protein ComEA
MRGWLTSNGIILVVTLVVALGGSALAFARPAPTPIEVRALEPPVPTIALIYVHVDGAVAQPGVYALASGSRVFEAIESAGGLIEDAEVRELNLAARVTDGQKLVVPVRRTEAVAASDEAVPMPASAQSAAAASSPSNSPARIGLNTATQKILESLPGIGPVTATKIIEFRQSNGPFTRIEQLREARLVNQSVYQRIQSLVAVD